MLELEAAYDEYRMMLEGLRLLGHASATFGRPMTGAPRCPQGCDY